MKLKQTFSLEEDLIKALKILAVNNNRTFSEELEIAIKKHLNIK